MVAPHQDRLPNIAVPIPNSISGVAAANGCCEGVPVCLRLGVSRQRHSPPRAPHGTVQPFHPRQRYQDPSQRMTC